MSIRRISLHCSLLPKEAAKGIARTVPLEHSPSLRMPSTNIERLFLNQQHALDLRQQATQRVPTRYWSGTDQVSRPGNLMAKIAIHSTHSRLRTRVIEPVGDKGEGLYLVRDLSHVAEEYSENGFAIIRDVIPTDLIDEARSHIAWLMERYPDVRPEHLHHPLIRNDAFWVRLISDSRLTDIAKYFLGPNLACFTAHYICKPPLDGQPVLWHQDGAYWKLEPMQALTVWLAVDRSSTENGCLRMIPKSHQLPLRTPSVRTDTPNMLYSITDEDVVSEWVDKHGIVDIELNPGDVSIHHPHLLHCSEANTSPNRRCGLDIGYISTSTRISSDGLYLDPVLVRGEPVEGVNTYRSLPRYTPGETIPFVGHEAWNERIGAPADAPSADRGEESPIEVTQRMITRLREGSVAR